MAEPPPVSRQVLVVDDSSLILQLSDAELDDDLCHGQQEAQPPEESSPVAHPRRLEIVSGSVTNCHRYWQTGSAAERRRLESTDSVVDQRRWDAESAANHLRRSELCGTTDPCRPEAAIIMADPRRSETGGRALPCGRPQGRPTDGREHKPSPGRRCGDGGRRNTNRRVSPRKRTRSRSPGGDHPVGNNRRDQRFPVQMSPEDYDAFQQFMQQRRA